MESWLKKNWFKAGVLSSLLIISLSVAYYYILFLPNKEKLSQQLQVSQSKSNINVKIAKGTLDLQERCAKAAEEFFMKNKSGDSTIEDYRNHYNQELNKCFILMNSTKCDKSGCTNTENLVDVFSRKDYAGWFWMNNEGKKYWEVEPQSCELLDEPCKCTGYFPCVNEFDNFVKKYMEQN